MKSHFDEVSTGRRPLPYPPMSTAHRKPERERAFRVLLVTSSLGSGHARAAQAIGHALRSQFPYADVQTLDYWTLMDQKVAHAIRSTYLHLVQEHPDLYDRVYQLDQKTWRALLESNDAIPPEITAITRLFPTSFSADETVDTESSYPTDRALVTLLVGILLTRSRSANNPLTRLILVKRLWRRLLSRFSAHVRACNPDVLIATQMVPAAIMARARVEGRFDAPTVGVVTDFGVHDFWIQPGIDYYCVGHESFADLRAEGVPRSRVRATGIPLMPGFTRPPNANLARRELGLTPDKPVVMIAGGGLGLGVSAVADMLLTQSSDCQLLVVVGQNALAASEASALSRRHPGRMKVFRWTDNMERLMRAADVVVGKPGGLTVAETLTCGRPLIATQSLKGQEGFNVNFLEANGAGMLIDEKRLPDVLQQLLSDRKALTHMQEKSAAVGVKSGTQSIVDLVSGLVARPSSHWAAEANV